MMDLGFRRHENDKKAFERKGNPKKFRLPRLVAFSVDQGYSLVGCSPAEPTSAYPDAIKIIPTFNFDMKSYPHTLGFR